MALFNVRRKPQNETRKLSLEDLFNYRYYGTIDKSYINQLSALENEAVYASIKIIAETLAGFPIQTFIKNGDIKTKDNSYFLYRTLNYPNAELDKFTFWETFYTNLLTHGNAYAYIYRDSFSSYAQSLFILPSKYVSVKRNNGKLEYHFKEPTKELKIYKKENVFHIKLTSFDGLVGLSPMELFKLQILESITADNYNYNFFDKGILSNIALNIPNNNNYTKEQINYIKQQFINSHGGLKNQNEPIVLDSGTEIKEFKGYSNKDNSIVELRKEALLKIARVYRIPPHMLQELGNATYSNIAQQSLDFYKQTLLPHIQRIEWGLIHQLIPSNHREKRFVKLNISSVLRASDNERASYYDIMQKNGNLSINEVRRLEDLPPIEAAVADYHFNQLNMSPIEVWQNDKDKDLKI